MIVETATQQEIELNGGPLTIAQIGLLSNQGGNITLSHDPAVRRRIDATVELVGRAVRESWSVYGVTTGFGGMADVPVPCDLASASQNNLLSFLAAGTGPPIARQHVRAAMALRANVLLQGKSGVRFEIIERLVRFLRADALPVVRELGSIGASGDLVPLSSIARAITGQNNRARVRLAGRECDAIAALKELDLEPLSLLPKEGLAIVNGTSFSAAIAANVVHEARWLMSVALAAHAMILRALQVQEESFAAFVHEQKPHPGQLWTASLMRRLLSSGIARSNGKSGRVQDRYSLRCFAQYMGPLIEGLARVAKTVEIEMNAVSDNPLVDVDHERFYQSGNFLGQYLGVAMDDLRRYLGLTAKHLDVQIATLVAPEFSNGLPPSLRGNDALSYNMGLKGLQITGNSIVPTLVYYGNPIVEHFPTHAEQFNQNVNGLSWSSANLAWSSIELFREYLTIALVFAVQALDLRARSNLGHCDGRTLIGSQLTPVYELIYDAVEKQPGRSEPFLFDDADTWLEDDLQSLRQELVPGGRLREAAREIYESLLTSAPSVAGD